MSSQSASKTSSGESESVRIKRSEADTALFGINFFEVDCNDTDAQSLRSQLATSLSQLSRNEPIFATTKVPSGRIDLTEALGQNGFYHAESLSRLTLKLDNLQPMSPELPFPVRRFEVGPDRIEDVAQLAGRIFSVDRLHLDPHIPGDKVDERYRQWVRRSLTDGSTVIAHENLETGQIVSFVHYRQTAPGEVTWFLGGLDSSLQKARIGASLIGDYLLSFKEGGWQNVVTYVALTLLPLVQTYTRFGFRISDIVQVFHCYMDPSGPDNTT